jgi:cell pole-organizing protein PopZ
MRQAGEPSVEEILDSIKKVIARDNRSVAAEAQPRPQQGAVPIIEDAEEDDILDLDSISELVEPVSTADDAPLLPIGTVSSISESLAALAVMAEPRAAPQIVRSGETSLEGLTRELLRPALAEWLDRNLPPLVEKLVATEIARIVGKKA